MITSPLDDFLAEAGRKRKVFLVIGRINKVDS